MAAPNAFGKVDIAKHTQESFLHKRNSVPTADPGNSTSPRGIDRSTACYPKATPTKTRNSLVQPQVRHRHFPYSTQGYLQKAPAHVISQAIPRQHSHITENAVTDILPYCTTEPPLRQDQVIALSDVVGSIRELVLLGLSAAGGDVSSSDNLVDAVGTETAINIVEFFVGEWEVE
jgi:hypothetical protein